MPPIARSHVLQWFSTNNIGGYRQKVDMGRPQDPPVDLGRARDRSSRNNVPQIGLGWRNDDVRAVHLRAVEQRSRFRPAGCRLAGREPCVHACGYGFHDATGDMHWLLY